MAAPACPGRGAWPCRLQLPCIVFGKQGQCVVVLSVAMTPGPGPKHPAADRQDHHGRHLHSQLEPGRAEPVAGCCVSRMFFSQ